MNLGALQPQRLYRASTVTSKMNDLIGDKARNNVTKALITMLKKLKIEGRYGSLFF